MTSIFDPTFLRGPAGQRPAAAEQDTIYVAEDTGVLSKFTDGAWTTLSNPSSSGTIVTPVGTPNGVDDTAAFAAAVASCPVGGIVQFTRGQTYHLTSTAITKAITVDLNGAEIIADPTGAGTTGDPVFWFKGTRGTDRLIEDALRSAFTVVLRAATVTGDFAVGDYVVIEDDKSVNVWDASGVGYAGQGEVNVVTAVSVDGFTITLAKPLDYDYNTVPRIVHLTPLDRPVLKNGDVAEVDPGGTFGGALTGNAPHIAHFQYCYKPKVRDLGVDGWNVHAVNFNYCADPIVERSNGNVPFRPATGGHGIFARFDRCLSGRAVGNTTRKARHTVDWVTSLDGGSEGNTAIDTQFTAYFCHGLASRRISSVDDRVVGAADTASGWTQGNPSFSADYGFTVVNPRYVGQGVPVTQGALSEDMTVLNPEFHPDAFGIKQVTGAKRLKVRGGVVELARTLAASYYLLSRQKSETTDATGAAPTDVSVLGTTFRGGTGRLIDTSENIGTVELDESYARRSESILSGHGLSTGIEAVSRVFAVNSAALGSQQAFFTYFTARKTVTVSQVRTRTRGTAASGLTLARIGLYTVAANGDLTLVASTTNDTTLWAATFTAYTKNLDVSYTLVAGTRYAVGILAVGTTMPALYAYTISAMELDLQPRPCSFVTGQAALPATMADASLTAGSATAGTMFYAVLL